MKYILIIVLSLSLPVLALETNTSEYKNEKHKINVLQKKIQNQIKKEGLCDPEKNLHLPPFN